MVGNERLLRRMSIGDILDYSIELYKRNFKKLFMLSLVLYIPFVLIYTAVNSYLTGDLLRTIGLDVSSDAFTDAPDAVYKFLAQMVILLIMGLFYVVFAITLQPVLDASVTRIIYDDAVNGKISEWRQTVKKSFKSFGKLVLNRLLFGLILYGVSTAAVLALYFAIFLVILLLIPLTLSNAGIHETTLMAIGILLFAIACIAGLALFIGYFAMRFGLGTQSVIIENTTASKAISRSHELTSKKFWHSGLTAGTALLMTTMLPSALASAAYFLIFIDKNLYTLGNVASQLIAAIFQPFLTVVLTMIFIDLKVRKEGLDLEVKVDAMLENEKKREELLQGGEGTHA